MLDALLGWDERIFRLLNGNWLNPILDHLLPFATDAGNFILPFVVAAIVIVLVGRVRGLRFLVLAVVSVVVADAIGTHIFKYSFLRARPCIALADVRLLVGCTNLPSFPSNHAVNASVLATLTTIYIPRLWLPATALAILVGYSRVYVGVHYPLDVLAGSVLGIVVALAFSGVMNFVWPLSSEPAKRRSIFPIKIGDS
jgi:undecaprenyl-diphosphatase